MSNKRAASEELVAPAAKRQKVEEKAAAADSGAKVAAAPESKAAGAGDSKAATPSLDSFAKSESFVKSTEKTKVRLAKEFARAQESKDFTVTLVGNDLFLWEAKIPFDSSTLLGQDLAKYTKDKCVVIRLAFDVTHPFKAPFVRVLKPRFQKGTSNVQEGGAICIDLFTQSGWSPAITAEKAIVSVQSQLLTPTIISRLDPTDHAREYTVEEAIRSQNFILQAHKEWNLSPAEAAAAQAGAGAGAAAGQPVHEQNVSALHLVVSAVAGAGAGARAKPKKAAAGGRKKKK